MNRHHAIDAAFRSGDLAALRDALDDSAAVPNGTMPRTIGNCLVYAIFHSPLRFIRQLLDLGADPNAVVDDGFPSLIAAIGASREAPGAPRRADVDDIVRLLLDRGADPNQRGLNDFTALHMAVVERNQLAVQRLLDAGADPGLRTRIDEMETPLELADALSLTHIADTLRRNGRSLGHRLRSGIELAWDVPGTGDPVIRQATYLTITRIWLPDGLQVEIPADRAAHPELAGRHSSEARLIRVNRGSTISGLFYGLHGMRVGGTRRLHLAPHVAYGAEGIPGLIPPRSPLDVEVTVLARVATEG